MKKQETNAAELMLQQAHNLLDSAEAIAKENAELKKENSEILADLHIKNDKCSNLQAENNEYLARLNNLKQANEELENKQKEIDDLRAELAITKRELKKAKDTLNKEPNFGWCWNKVGDGTPLDQEQVLVRTKDGVLYLKTYTPECGFRELEVAWMSIPEYKQGGNNELFERIYSTYDDDYPEPNDEQKQYEYFEHLCVITNGLQEMARAAGRDLSKVDDNQLLAECYNLIQYYEDGNVRNRNYWSSLCFAKREGQHPYLFWREGSLEKPIEERKYADVEHMYCPDQVYKAKSIEDVI